MEPWHKMSILKETAEFFRISGLELMRLLPGQKSVSIDPQLAGLLTKITSACAALASKD